VSESAHPASCVRFGSVFKFFIGFFPTAADGTTNSDGATATQPADLSDNGPPPTPLALEAPAPTPTSEAAADTAPPQPAEPLKGLHAAIAPGVENPPPNPPARGRAATPTAAAQPTRGEEIRATILDPGADLPGFTPVQADRLLDEVYGDHPHQNDGRHLDGGIEGDATWQRRCAGWSICHRPTTPYRRENWADSSSPPSRENLEE
jgi:hypothetical protein